MVSSGWPATVPMMLEMLELAIWQKKNLAEKLNALYLVEPMSSRKSSERSIEIGIGIGRLDWSWAWSDVGTQDSRVTRADS